jgi:regulatory protein
MSGNASARRASGRRPRSRRQGNPGNPNNPNNPDNPNNLNNPDNPNNLNNPDNEARTKRLAQADPPEDAVPTSGNELGAGRENDTAGRINDRDRDRGASRDDGSHRGDDPEERARQICLRLLTLAPRSRAQLADALHRRGIPGHVADSVLDRFTDAGLIDDAAFARAWVESRHYSRGLAGRALTAELRQRGVDDEEIREAVAELGPDADVTTARELVRQKLPATRGQPAQARVRRLAGMLARKGYSPGLAFRVIREALEAEGTDADLEEEPVFDDPYFDTE